MATIDLGVTKEQRERFGPYTILSAVVATGDSDVLALGNIMSAFTWDIVYAGGTLTATSITLKGSLDNSNWGDLDTSTNISGEMVHIVNKPVRYLKVNWGTRTVNTGTPAATVKVSGRIES
jgi:hypothetical protein